MFWLLAYFWHFSRASLVILLDPELKSAVPSVLPRGTNAAHLELEPNNNEPGIVIQQKDKKFLASPRNAKTTIGKIMVFYVDDE